MTMSCEEELASFSLCTTDKGCATPQAHRFFARAEVLANFSARRNDRTEEKAGGVPEVTNCGTISAIGLNNTSRSNDKSDSKS